MLVKFLERCVLTQHTNICCFSGSYRAKQVEIKEGQVIEVGDVWRGEKVKCKGKGFYPCTLTIANENLQTVHPDRYVDVPSTIFEIVSDRSTSPSPA